MEEMLFECLNAPYPLTDSWRSRRNFSQGIIVSGLESELVGSERSRHLLEKILVDTQAIKFDRRGGSS